MQPLEEYDYFIIASETSRHINDLNFIINHTSGKLLLCEKPLFEKYYPIDIKNHQIYVAYHLRYHPALIHLKQQLKSQPAISAHLYCGQYLPTWRENRDYRTTYSASISEGGGVLLDLSHELDLTQWLFGPLHISYSQSEKISDLQIDSDDHLNLIGITEYKTRINLALDYISKIPRRDIIVHQNNGTHFIDLIKSTYQFNQNKLIHFSLNTDTLTFDLHQDVLSQQNIACSFDEAVLLMKTIDHIQKQKT